MLLKLPSREKVITYLNSYTAERSEEIDKHRTTKPLLKSFILETSLLREGLSEIEHGLFANASVERLDGEVFRVLEKGTNPENPVGGILEPVFDRYIILYSTNRSEQIDKFVSRLVAKTIELDHLWISGMLFSHFWNIISSIHEGHRYSHVKFYYAAHSEPEMDDAAIRDEGEEREHPGSVLSFIGRLDSLAAMISRFQQMDDVMPAIKSLDMVRFPCIDGRGGHDFYFDGKVTNRSSSFFDHRNQMLHITQIYKRVTETIENLAWMEYETIRLSNGTEGVSLRGVPVYILFPTPLHPELFQKFVHQTFQKGRGPFRLWGNPIRVTSKRVHVYGIDMHHWQEIYLELTPKAFTIIIPRGTCGNTVHRLVTNIQRYLEPRIRVYIGNERFEDIVRVATDDIGEGAKWNGRGYCQSYCQRVRQHGTT